jgi:hypothetical protein
MEIVLNANTLCAFVLKMHSFLLLNAVVFLVTSGIHVEQHHLLSLHIIYAVFLLGNTVMKRVYGLFRPEGRNTPLFALPTALTDD